MPTFEDRPKTLPSHAINRKMRNLRICDILQASFHDSSQLLQSLIGQSLINDIESLFEEIQCLKSISQELFKGYVCFLGLNLYKILCLEI